jgi:hypothetical protein
VKQWRIEFRHDNPALTPRGRATYDPLLSWGGSFFLLPLNESAFPFTQISRQLIALIRHRHRLPIPFSLFFCSRHLDKSTSQNPIEQKGIL